MPLSIAYIKEAQWRPIDQHQCYRADRQAVQVITSTHVLGIEADSPGSLLSDLLGGPTQVINNTPKADPFGYDVGTIVDYRGKLHGLDRVAAGPPSVHSRQPTQWQPPGGYLCIDTPDWMDCLPYEMIQLVGVIGTTLVIVTPYLTYELEASEADAAKVVGTPLGAPLPMYYAVFPQLAYWDTSQPRVYVNGVKVMKGLPRHATTSAFHIIRDHRNDEAHQKAREVWEAKGKAQANGPDR